MVTKKLKCVLLIDDDNDCNFFHQRLLKKMNCAEQIQTARDGIDALKFLSTQEHGQYPAPEIIFLDINMPRMNGWEFLDAYSKLDPAIKGSVVLVMLTTSLNPDDRERAKSHPEVNGFNNKYLDRESLERILAEHFTQPSSISESQPGPVS